MKDYKICLIVPYFGRFHQYFQLVLSSMEMNRDIDWLIFTDDTRDFAYPDNVSVVYMSFAGMQEYIQDKFDFPIALPKPYKLCDYKPAYGYIFEEYIRGYDFWGHCDNDVIFGRLRKWLPDELLERYDKIFELGHLTLYRNTEENNRRFMLPVNGRYRYREVFASNKNEMFDEVGVRSPFSVSTIFQKYGFPVWREHYGADIAQKSCFFNVAETCTDGISCRFEIKQRKHQIFWYQSGVLKCSYMERGNYCEKEYMYMHLIRRTRNMKVRVDVGGYMLYKIIPHEFAALKEPLNETNYPYCRWWNFNLHYFEIRMQNLFSKLRNFFRIDGIGR